MSKKSSQKVKKDYSAWRTAKRLVRDLKPIAWAIALSGLVCIMSVALSSIAPELVSLL